MFEGNDEGDLAQGRDLIKADQSVINYMQAPDPDLSGSAITDPAMH